MLTTNFHLKIGPKCQLIRIEIVGNEKFDSNRTKKKRLMSSLTNLLCILIRNRVKNLDNTIKCFFIKITNFYLHQFYLKVPYKHYLVYFIVLSIKFLSYSK